MRATALTLTALTAALTLSPVSLAQDRSADAAKVIGLISELYGGQDGAVVTVTRAMDASESAISIPSNEQSYGVLVIRPNLIRTWEVPGEGGVMTLSPGIDSTGEEMIQSLGGPVKIYSAEELPADFEAVLGDVEAGDGPRSVVAMIPGLLETLTLFTEGGFVINGTSLSELEYAGIEGEDTDLTHVFRGETGEGGEDSQRVEVRFEAVGEPRLRSVVTEAELRAITGAGGEQRFKATMTSTFSEWRWIPSVDLTEGRERVEDLSEAMESRMQRMHGPGQN